MPRLRSFRTVAAFCVTLFVTTASAFTEDSRIGILGDDDRRMIEERGTPWSAIGQINVTGYRRITWCTGSLSRDQPRHHGGSLHYESLEREALSRYINYIFWRA